MPKNSRKQSGLGEYELYDDTDNLYRKKAWIFEFYPVSTSYTFHTVYLDVTSRQYQFL